MREEIKKKKMKYSNINWEQCEEQILKIQRKIIVAWIKTEKGQWTFCSGTEGDNRKLFNIESIPILTYIMIKDVNLYQKENEEYLEKRSFKEFGKELTPLVYKLSRNQKMICPVCKTSIRKVENEKLEIHHRLAKASSGTNKISNLMVLHKTCHSSVTNCNNPKLYAKYITEGIILPKD